MTQTLDALIRHDPRLEYADSPNGQTRIALAQDPSQIGQIDLDDQTNPDRPRIIVTHERTDRLVYACFVDCFKAAPWTGRAIARGLRKGSRH